MTFTTTVYVREREWTVRWDPRNVNLFTAWVDGEEVRCTNFDAVQGAINNVLRKHERAVRVEFVDPGTGRKGVATRLHASRQPPSVVWENGVKETVEVRSPLRPTVDVEKLERLHREAAAAARALHDYQREHLFERGQTLGDLVKKERTRLAEEEAAKHAAEAAQGLMELDS